MQKKKHLLSDIWDSYPELLPLQSINQQKIDISKIIADILAIGPFYYYTVNIGNYSLSQVSEKILDIHGLDKFPESLQDIMDLIHPDDLNFILQAEKASIEKIKEIGIEFQLYLKSSYCFRMRIADGSYHLFHHQSIHLGKDEQNRLLYSLNIHTDIQHITTKNNHIVLVSGIGKRKDYFQIDLSRSQMAEDMPLLSNREREVLFLVANGDGSKQIASKLFISELTVKVHRRNLLKKTNTVNSSDMIRRCMELGFI